MLVHGLAFEPGRVSRRRGHRRLERDEKHTITPSLSLFGARGDLEGEKTGFAEDPLQHHERVAKSEREGTRRWYASQRHKPNAPNRVANGCIVAENTLTQIGRRRARTHGVVAGPDPDAWGVGPLLRTRTRGGRR